MSQLTPATILEVSFATKFFQFQFHDALLVAEYERLAPTEGPYNNRDVS